MQEPHDGPGRATTAEPAPAADEPAISVSGLVKSYGEVRALDGVDFEAAPGTVLGLLGPNGAGKTTAVRVLTTLLSPTRAASASPGLDVVRDAAPLRERIGLAGQYAAVDENLTGEENLVMVGRLYGERRARRRQARAAELLERFDLADAGRARRPRRYSGGMRRRLDLAGGARRAAAGAVPRRADDRARPAQPARRCGRRSRGSSPTARPCCSRPSTSTRPTGSPTASR